MAHFLCCVNLIIEAKEKGGSGREERRMRRSCRYRRRRSHSLCRDVRGVGGCTLHRWTTLLHSGGGEHLQGKPLPRVYTSSPLLPLQPRGPRRGLWDLFCGPFTRSRCGSEQRADAYFQRKYFQRKYWTAQRTFQEDTTCTFNESSAGFT